MIERRLMDYGSLFTGIGGFDLALNRAGFTCAWQAETDTAAASLLSRQFPGVTNYGDVKNVRYGVEPVGLICGGFPCQDLSVAGKRAGLAGERSGLWFEFARIIGELKPGWIIIENVPGLLSSDGGRDMETIIRSLVEFGYGVAWRVLDAQYFGLAQRRKRVFIVASLGNGRAAEVLFEREGGAGNTPPRRETGEGTAGTIDAKSASSNRGSQANEHEFLAVVSRPLFAAMGTKWNGNGDLESSLIAFGGNRTSGEIEIATALNAHGGTGRSDFESETFITEIHGGSVRKDRPNGGFYTRQTETTKPLDTSGLNPACNQGGVLVGVRRLTPTECERLQGFPDGWTAGQSDSARYRQLGNAVAVPVVEWIAMRIRQAQRQIRMDI